MTDHLGYAWHGLNATLDDPFMERSQFCDVTVLGFQVVGENLTHTAGHRAHLKPVWHIHTFRDSFLCQFQSFRDHPPGLADIDVVFEIDVDGRQTK